MNFPDSAFWGHILATLGIEAGCLVALGFAAQRFMRDAIWHRAVWRGSILCLLLLTISEWTGIGRGAAGFFFGQKLVTQNFSTPSLPMIAPVVAPRFLVSGVNLPSPKAPASIWWPGWAWLGGTVVVLLRMTAAQAFLLTLRLRREKITNDALRRRVDQVTRCVRLRRRITLLRMPRAISPMAFGIVRPTLGLPPGFESKLTVAEQEAVLAHELAHLAAKDTIWFLVADVTTALLCWHPFVWWARRSLHGASELAADEASAMLPDGPSALATCLVSFGKEMSACSAWGWIGINGGFQSILGKRVERLVQMPSSTKQTFSGRLGTTGRMVAGLLVIPGSVLFFGALQSAHAQKQESLPNQLQRSWDSSPAAQMWTTFSGSTQTPQAATNADAADDIIETIAPSGASIKRSQISTNVANVIAAAKHLYEMGKYEEAKALFDSVLENNPGDKTAQYYLALIREARFNATNQTLSAPLPPTADGLFTKTYRVNPNRLLKSDGFFEHLFDSGV
jgi:Zn-dependent protease with chaperone function